MRLYGALFFHDNLILITITATTNSPTQAALADEAKDFHKTLGQVMNYVPAHHFAAQWSGEMNARLDKLKESEDYPRYYFYVALCNWKAELLLLTGTTH